MWIRNGAWAGVDGHDVTCDAHQHKKIRFVRVTCLILWTVNDCPVYRPFEWLV